MWQTSSLLHLLALCAGRGQSICLEIFADRNGERGVVVSCTAGDVSDGSSVLRPVAVGCLGLRSGNCGEFASILGNGSI